MQSLLKLPFINTLLMQQSISLDRDEISIFLDMISSLEEDPLKTHMFLLELQDRIKGLLDADERAGIGVNHLQPGGNTTQDGPGLVGGNDRLGEDNPQE